MVKVDYNNGIYYKICIFFLTALEFLNVFSNAHNAYYKLPTVILGVLFFSFGIVHFIFNNFSLRKLIFIFSLFIILLISSFNTFFIVPLIIAISFVEFTPFEVIRGYYFSNLYCLVATILLALFGLSPLRNPNDGILSFGFANENTLGLFMLLISSFYLLEIKRGNNHNKYYKVAFILLFILMDLFVIDDRTVALVFFVFLLLSYLIKAQYGHLLKVICYIGCLLPAILTYGSWIAMKNYNNSSYFYYILNNVLSNRFLMWNWFYRNIPISLFPNSLQVNRFNYWGTVDGSYAKMLLQSGIIITLIVCLLLILCNILLIRHNYYDIFCLLFSLELGAFSENILQLPTIAYVIIFALMSLYPKWLDNSEKINL